MFKITSIFKYVKPNFNTSMHLFDHMIKPVILYGSEIWGDNLFHNTQHIYHNMKKDMLEKCHLKFCRYILGVNRKAPNIGIYGDTGRFPVTMHIAINVAKYWHRLYNLNESTNKLLHCGYLENVTNKWPKSWFLNVQNMLHVANCEMNVGNKARALLINSLKTNLKETFSNEWENELFCDRRKNNHGNKLRTYRLFKPKWGFEEYLNICVNDLHRKALSRLRLGAH